jgi:hypothetical protein
MTFENFCSEKGININVHHFLFKGVKLSSSKLGLRNRSVMSVHLLRT